MPASCSLTRILSIAALLLILIECSHKARPVVTLVTGLYDIGRGQIQTFRRDFNYYLHYFKLLLKTPCNMIIFGDKDLEKFVQ